MDGTFFNLNRSTTLLQYKTFLLKNIKHDSNNTKNNFERQYPFNKYFCTIYSNIITFDS